MDRKNEAIELFRTTYGEDPSEYGFYAIDIYEKQHAFLYAISQDVINAYKTQQNIIRLMLTWFMWPLLLDTFICGLTLFIYQDMWHPTFLACCAFYVIWGILLLVLYLKVKQTNTLIKLNETITYLNY